MYLSMIRLKKDATTSTQDKISAAIKMAKIKKKYGNIQNEQNVHRMICDMAGGCKRKDKNLLYMKFDSLAESLYIQSDEPLDCSVVEELGYEFVHPSIDMKKMLEQLQAGDRVMLRAKFAPVERKSSSKTVHSLAYVPNGYKKRAEWMKRNAESNGFRIISLEEGPCNHIVWNKNDDKGRVHDSWTNAFYYACMVEVIDVDVFRDAIMFGIGKYKAYGCGLMLISKA